MAPGWRRCRGSAAWGAEATLIEASLPSKRSMYRRCTTSADSEIIRRVLLLSASRLDAHDAAERARRRCNPLHSAKSNAASLGHNPVAHATGNYCLETAWRRGHRLEADRQHLPVRPVPRLDQGPQSRQHRRRRLPACLWSQPGTPPRGRRLAVQREGCGCAHKEKGPAEAEPDLPAASRQKLISSKS
jgi:hypothetical protein